MQTTVVGDCRRCERRCASDTAMSSAGVAVSGPHPLPAVTIAAPDRETRCRSGWAPFLSGGSGHVIVDGAFSPAFQADPSFAIAAAWIFAAAAG